jgi:hypothetical protein
MQFEIADFEMTYNAFLRRSTLTKFVAVAHYAYLILKMLGPNGVMSIRGDVTWDPSMDLGMAESKISKLSI